MSIIEKESSRISNHNRISFYARDVLEEDRKGPGSISLLTM